MAGLPAREGAAGTLLDVAVGLARDIALFDQRGCLSIGAVYVAGPPEKALALGRRLAAELAELARRWPPGPPVASELAAVQQLRLEAEMRGLAAPPLRGPDGALLPLAAGTVVVEPEPAFRPSPGLRTVRVHPIADLKELPSLLAVCRGRLQGAALAGADAWRLEGRLRELGLSRLAVPGELQSATASWHNGGLDPLALLVRS